VTGDALAAMKDLNSHRGVAHIEFAMEKRVRNAKDQDLINSSAGIDFPVLESRLQRWKPFSCTGKPALVLESIFL